MSNADFIRGIYSAFAKGDVPTVLGGLDPQVKWSEAEGSPYQPSRDPFVGPDAVLNEVFMKLGADWDGFAVHPGAFHEAGDVVVVEGRYSGKHKKTGAPLDAQMSHVWTVKGGKVVRFQQYTDTAQFQRLLGARD